jgi:hypothetical protein
MDKVEWNGKRWYEADFGWEEGKFCTPYWITFKMYRGEHMFYKKVFRYVLAEGEDLQTMLEIRTKSIASIFQM